MRKIILFYVFFSFLFVSCSNGQVSESNHDNYEYVNYEVAENCSAYGMIFKKGNYIFRFALSGSCDSFTSDDFSNVYNKFLTENQQKISSKKGRIIIDFYSPINQQKIIKLTESIFLSKVTLIKIEKERFELEIK